MCRTGEVVNLIEAYEKFDSMVPACVSREAALGTLRAGIPDGAIVALLESAFCFNAATEEMLKFVRSLEIDPRYMIIVDLIENRFTDSSFAS